MQYNRHEVNNSTVAETLGLDDKLATFGLECVWELGTAAEELLQQLYQEEPWIAPFYSHLSKQCPAATTVKSFLSQTSVRPSRHHRCFYIDSDRFDSIQSDGGVFAIKGSEIQSLDIGQALDQLCQRHDLRCLSLMEHFPCVEQKVPGALCLDEALDEAKTALDFQTAFVDRFGGLAQVPVPLFVFRWTDTIVDTFIEGELYPRLSRRPKEAVGRLLRNGLGCYVYYYPNIPLRVTNIADYVRAEANPGTYTARMELLQQRVNPEEVIESWLNLVAQMLALGFSPVTLSHAPTGQCVSVQNAVIDGGFVDVDSLQRFSEMRDDRDVFVSLSLMLKELVNTVVQFIGPPGSHGPGGYQLLDRAEDTIASVSYFLRINLSQIIADAMEQGIRFDPRVSRYFSLPFSFRDLDALFQELEPDLQQKEMVVT